MITDILKNGKTITAVAGFISAYLLQRFGVSLQTVDIVNGISAIIGLAGLAHKAQKAVKTRKRVKA